MYMKKDVALTLSCGGARGLAHIGVIRALEARGYSIRAVAGCSIGSVVGAFYAMGRLDALEGFMRTVSTDNMTDYLDFALTEQGFIRGGRFIEKLKELAPDCPIESLPVRLSIVAANLTTGRAEVFTRGSVYEAVRASIAIPAVLTPVEKEGARLVDGSVVNPLPVDQALPGRRELSIAVNLYAYGGGGDIANRPGAPGAKAPTPIAYLRAKYKAVRSWRTNLLTGVFSNAGGPAGYVGTIRSIFDLMTQRLIAQTLAAHPVDVVVEVPMLCASVFDFPQADALIRLGRSQADRALSEFERRRPRFHLPWNRRKKRGEDANRI